MLDVDEGNAHLDVQDRLGRRPFYRILGKKPHTSREASTGTDFALSCVSSLHHDMSLTDVQLPR